MKRIIKQILIVVIVFAAISALAVGVIWLLRVRPNCFDGIQNGQEEGVDCGSVCNVSCPTKKPTALPIKAKSVQIAQGGDKCDIIVDVENPNDSLGAERIPYDIVWGTIRKKGEFYIYPSESRYIAEMNLLCQQGQNPDVKIGQPANWEFLRADYRKPNLEISDSKFNYPENSYEFAEVTGMVTNKSPFDLKEVEIYAVIKDGSGNIIAISKTTVNSLLVNEKREFRIFWTHQFAKNGTGSFFTTSNLFNSDNFLKAMGAESGKWGTNENTNNQ
ncbi:MAG: FxLYD domain-containing protein [Candidatus Moraniibacteriota bacterium]